MSDNSPTLHLIAGKICAGKSTLAAELGQAPNTVVISEDAWLSTLFGDEMRTLADYVRCSGRLRAAMAPHLIKLLTSGTSLVLDFAANTPEQRAWVGGIIDAAGCRHELHFLDVPDAICRARLHVRNAGGEHPFAVTDAQFDQITSYFVVPTADEGFEITLHHHDDPRDGV